MAKKSNSNATETHPTDAGIELPLSDEITGDGSGEAPPPFEDNQGEQVSDPTVQLTRNAAGHQFGETMPRSRAEALGILDATRPFPGATTR